MRSTAAPPVVGTAVPGGLEELVRAQVRTGGVHGRVVAAGLAATECTRGTGRHGGGASPAWACSRVAGPWGCRQEGRGRVRRCRRGRGRRSGPRRFGRGCLGLQLIATIDSSLQLASMSRPRCVFSSSALCWAARASRSSSRWASKRLLTLTSATNAWSSRPLSCASSWRRRAAVSASPLSNSAAAVRRRACTPPPHGAPRGDAACASARPARGACLHAGDLRVERTSPGSARRSTPRAAASASCRSDWTVPSASGSGRHRPERESRSPGPPRRVRPRRRTQDGAR